MKRTLSITFSGRQEAEAVELFRYGAVSEWNLTTPLFGRLVGVKMIYINEILDGAADVVNRRTLKPLLRDSILRDAVHVF